MYYNALKTVSLNEADWAPEIFRDPKHRKLPKEYTFTQDMVDKGIAINLPENDFIGGLQAEKLLTPAKDQKKAKETAEAWAKKKAKELAERNLSQGIPIDAIKNITKETSKIVNTEVKKAVEKINMANAKKAEVTEPVKEETV